MLIRTTLFKGWRLTVVQVAEGDLIPHFQYNRSKSFNLLLHLRDSRPVLHLLVRFQKLVQ